MDVAPTVPELPTPATPDPSWLNVPVRLRSELQHDIRNQHGRDICVIEDPVRGKYYQVGRREYDLISRLDGTRTVAEANALARQDDADSKPLSDEAASKVAAWLVQCNLANCPTVDHSQRLEKQANALQNQKLMGLLNPISIKFKLFDPTRFLDATQGFANSLFTRSFLILWCVVGFFGLYSVASQWSRVSDSSQGILAEGRWMWLLLVWVGLKALHEWAHGVACRRYGGTVPEAGMLLLLFTPMPFVNVTSSWRFPNRWHRFVVAAAGMYVELFISFIAMVVWANTSLPWLRDLCFNIFFLSSVTTVLFNANPLMRFDGYYMLSDALNIPNMYTKGLKWFGDRLKWLLFGTPRTTGICPPEEFQIVRAYGLAAFCWKVLISFSLLISASVLLYGVGLILALVGAVLWLAVPIYRFFQSTFASPTPNYRLHRVAFSAVTIASVFIALFTVLHGPARKSAPAIVQFENEQIMRANGDGFLQQIHVRDGQYVQAGELLVELRNDELQTEVANLKRQIRESEIKARIHSKSSELAKAQAEVQQRASLSSQLAEKQQQLANLKLVAPIDGYIFQRNLSNRKGEYVRRGDQILTLSQTNSRKILVSIDQEDLESIQSDELSALKVLIPGERSFRAKLTKVNARVSDRPSIPAFCASYGGPLAVEPILGSEDPNGDKFRLLSPRFDIELQVNQETGKRLSSGQMGRAFFATKRQSLGAYLYLKTRDWFQRQYQQATLTQ